MGKKGGKEEKSQPPMNAEEEERKRLKGLAFSKRLLSRAPSKLISPLEPSKTVVKQQGRDIVKKGQRKSRFLFSFPGLLAPISGGKIGELADLGTKNPILYLDFPQGRMKLFGTIVYPENKYLTLQFGRSKSVVCEDSFENMIVFSDARWIGKKDENPEELQLDFPKELNEGRQAEYDFKGGAGATTGEKSGGNKPGKEFAEPLSPDTELKDDVSEDSGPLTEINPKHVTEATPVRQSARTSGKTLNYAEPSSADDSISSDSNEHVLMEEKVDDKVDDTTMNSRPKKTRGSSQEIPTTYSSEKEYVGMETVTEGKAELSSLSVKESKEKSLNKRGTLVQATLSTLFEKAVKKSKTSARDSPGPKGSTSKRQRISSKQMTNEVKTEELSKKAGQSKRKNAGTGAARQRKQFQVQDDDIEEISSESQAQDVDDGDEDWAA